VEGPLIFSFNACELQVPDDYVNPLYRYGSGIVLREESQDYIIMDGEKDSLVFASRTDACMQGGSFVQ